MPARAYNLRVRQVTPPSIVVPERFNAASYFVDRNVDEGRGNHAALLFGGDVVTYATVLENVNRMGNGLRDLGVEIENRVALVLLDCPEFPYAFFGSLKIGAVPVPINTLLTADDYEFILEDSRAKVLVVSAALFPRIEPILPQLRYLKHIVMAEDLPEIAGRDPHIAEAGSEEVRLPCTNMAALLASQSIELEPADTHRDDVAFWLYTSGTTGSPSAAVHLHHDMVYCLELYAKGILGMNSEDRTFSVAKLFFAYGLGNSLYCPFGVGATSILFAGRPTPEAVGATVNRYRPTIFFGVPTSYADLLQAMDQGMELDTSSIRVATSAGESLSAHLYQRWLDQTGVHILDGIGTTEILHIFISNRLGDIRPGSTGKVVPGYEAKLVDDDGQPTPQGEIGNLMVRGDSICSSYWNKHDVTQQAIEGEWIRTRDKYHIDEDGYFWYDGRTNDMLKVGGRWVSPAEVESAAASHPSVLECAIVGVLDEENLEKPKAYVVLRDGTTATPEMAAEIQAFVRTRLAAYKYPREIEFLPELPKTATGKIQRYKLRQGA